MAFTHLLQRRDQGVEYLTLNRPEVRNAFDEHLIAELAEWAKQAACDRGIRAVVLAGAGPAFCAGADVRWMSKMVHYSREENVRDARAAAAMFAALSELPVPVIARVHGGAIGGGAGLAAIADIAVADISAVFGFTEVKLGLLPAIVAPHVLAKIGRSAADELFLTARRFSSDHALRIGLVHAVAAAGDLDRVVQEYVDDILAAGPDAIVAAKRLLRQMSNCARDEAVRLGVEAIAERRVSPEAQARLSAFLRKEK
jgi:methylglutaconyl-CoA hydratase